MTNAKPTGRTMRTDYFGRKADEAYEAFAGPFLDTMRAKYRTCKTAAELHALSRECWKQVDDASRMINRNGYDNMTRHGTGPYDRYSALYDQARSLAIEFFKKAKRIEGGEAPEAVMPHLSNPNAKETDSRICHSHDWCDANMAMDAAMRSLGINPLSGNGMPDEINDLWNKAWELAKPRLTLTH